MHSKHINSWKSSNYSDGFQFFAHFTIIIVIPLLLIFPDKSHNIHVYFHLPVKLEVMQYWLMYKQVIALLSSVFCLNSALYWHKSLILGFLYMQLDNLGFSKHAGWVVLSIIIYDMNVIASMNIIKLHTNLHLTGLCI